MKPGKSKINLLSPLLWNWSSHHIKDWILSPEGYNLSEEEISSMLSSEPDLSSYDQPSQLMGTLRIWATPTTYYKTVYFVTIREPSDLFRRF